MHAVRYYGNKDIRIEDIAEPQVKAGEVKIKVAWNGICGTDVHEYIAGPIFSAKDKPHPLTGEMLPVTFGHEFSGVIIEVGDGVDAQRYAVGKKVAIKPTLSCRDLATCPACADGLYNCCTKVGVVGLHGFGGGLGEYISLPYRMVHVLPDNIPLDIGACIEPLSVAWHAVHRTNFKKGDTCLVAGSGPIGLFVLKVLKSLGASAVYVSEPAHQWRQKASVHQADVVFDSLEVDIAPKVLKLTKGHGVDISFECAGAQPALQTAIMAMRARGVIMNVTGWEAPASLNINLLTLGEKTLTSTAIYVDDHPAVIEALANGTITNVEDLITKKICLEDIVEEGILALANDKDNQAKILVYPGKDVPTA